MRIGLLDAMGYGNLGDAAIQDSVIGHIRGCLPMVHIVGFSFVPTDTIKRHGIPCFPITRESQAAPITTKNIPAQTHDRPQLAAAVKRMPRFGAVARRLKCLAVECRFLARSYKTLRGLDLLIISGGGQICDLWGGPWAHPVNLFKFAILAKLARKRLYFLNVGAEPLNHYLSRFFIRCSLKCADYVSLRDLQSQGVVRKLGLKSKTFVRPDPAYALDVTDYFKTAQARSSKGTVGINPMGFCDPRVWPRKDQSAYEVYLQKLTTFSLWLLEQGYNLNLFTTSSGVDRLAVADLTKRLVESSAGSASRVGESGELPGRVQMLICDSLPELLKAISGCAVIVTSKYHGVVFSQILNKPVIAVSYQTKIKAAMEGTGQAQFCRDIEHFEAKWLIDSFRTVIAISDKIQSEQAAGVAGFVESLRNQFNELFSPANAQCRRAFSRPTTCAPAD